MDNSREEFMRNFDKYLIGLDDTFAFKCRSCGKCCKNREDIILNARDIHNIAAKLGFTMAETIETYCEVYIGPDSRIPIVRLEPYGVNKVCPLLKGDRCIVHDVKPTVCAAFPLGRVVSGENISEGIQPGKPMKIGYILNPIICGSVSRKQTVRSWLERFGIPIDDQFFIKWNETIIILSEHMRELEQKKASKRLLEVIWDSICTALYIAYDPKKDLMPQFEENSAKILDIFTSLKEAFPG